MEIGDWKATRRFGALYRQIRELGLEQNIAELDAFGFTILEPGKAAPLEWTRRLRQAILDVAERRTGVRHDPVTGEHGMLDTQPPFKHQYILQYLLFEDPIFQATVQNPYLLALQTYLLGFDCVLSTCSSFMKWQEPSGYGPTMGVHADVFATHPISVGKDAHTANSNWVLTDYTKDNGSMAFVPGSHRTRTEKGTRPPSNGIPRHLTLDHGFPIRIHDSPRPFRVSFTLPPKGEARCVDRARRGSARPHGKSWGWRSAASSHPSAATEREHSTLLHSNRLTLTLLW